MKFIRFKFNVSDLAGKRIVNHGYFFQTVEQNQLYVKPADFQAILKGVWNLQRVVKKRNEEAE